MSAPYTVEWGDRAGPLGSKTLDSFDEALALYRQKNANGTTAFMHGCEAELDGDRWFDGLTDEERDQL